MCAAGACTFSLAPAAGTLGQWTPFSRVWRVEVGGTLTVYLQQESATYASYFAEVALQRRSSFGPLSNDSFHSWVASAWGPCRSAVGLCGRSVQNRTVECISNFGRIVLDDLCGMGKPLQSVECATIPCLGASPSPSQHSSDPSLAVILSVVLGLVGIGLVALTLVCWHNRRRTGSCIDSSRRMDATPDARWVLGSTTAAIPVATAVPVALIAQQRLTGTSLCTLPSHGRAEYEMQPREASAGKSEGGL